MLRSRPGTDTHVPSLSNNVAAPIMLLLLSCPAFAILSTGHLPTHEDYIGSNQLWS